MIKFNKSTHLMILFSFTIIFVALYLYYTINDVKRMSNELKKINTDIQKLNMDIQGLNGSLNNLNLATNNLIIQKESPAVVKPINQKQSPSVEVNNLDDEDDDDATSVNTEDLKNIINENDDVEEEDVSKSEPEKKKDVLPVNDDDESDDNDDNDDLEEEDINTPVELIDFQKLKYEELKDLCKKKGISTKGTKDQLISKLQAA